MKCRIGHHPRKAWRATAMLPAIAAIIAGTVVRLVPVLFHR